MSRKTYSVTLLDLDVDLDGPGSMSDYIAIVGEEAALDNVVKSEIYRNSSLAPKIRADFIKAVMATEIDPATGELVKLDPIEVDKDGKGTKFPKDVDAVKELERKTGKKRSVWQSLMTEVCQKVNMDEALKRLSSNRPLGQEWIDQGEQVYNAIQERRAGDPSTFLSNVRKWVPGASLPDEFTAYDIGQLLKKQDAAKRKEDATSAV